MVRLSLAEASVKIRDGQINDEPSDLGLPYVAAVLPVGVRVGAPICEGGLGESRALEHAMLRHAHQFGKPVSGGSSSTVIPSATTSTST